MSDKISKSLDSNGDEFVLVNIFYCVIEII